MDQGETRMRQNDSKPGLDIYDSFSEAQLKGFQKRQKGKS